MHRAPVSILVLGALYVVNNGKEEPLHPTRVLGGRGASIAVIVGVKFYFIKIICR